jgi:hypothetical protein
MISLKGQYFDGRHPLGLAATLIVSDRQASLTGERSSQQYQIETLGVSPRIGRADRFVSFPDGGQLQCNDSPLLDARRLARTALGSGPDRYCAHADPAHVRLRVWIAPPR